MRLVVIGAGEVGTNIAANLADTHDIVIIDVDPDRVEELSYSYDVLAIEGDGTEIETLEEAEVNMADMVIACTDNDETNLVSCATTKAISDPFTVSRVRNTSYLATWQRSSGVFGVDFMVCTNLLSAEAIVRVAGLPAARDVDSFADGKVQMAEFDVAADSPIANQTVREADRFESLTFAAIIDEDVTIPRGDTVIRPGAQIVVIGTPESVEAFSEAIAPEMPRADNVTIVGSDAIVEETARLLEDKGVSCRLVSQDDERARTLAEMLPETIVMHHDPTDLEFLLREHVDKSNLVVVSLDSDEQTLLVSLLVKQVGNVRTVAVVQRGEYVNLFEAVGVDVALNPREVTAEEIVRFTHEGRTENVALIESDRAEVIEIEADTDSVLVNAEIQDVFKTMPDGVVIGAVVRDDEVIAPRGDTIVQPGDHVVLFVDARVIGDVLPVV